MQSIDVPISALEVSPRNARKAPAGESRLRRLEASIAAHGLLQPLIAEGTRERATVIGGGRRLAALRRLVEAGTLEAHHAVPCVLVSGDHTELSLAENSGREELHPVDQAEAFRALREAGLTDAELAARFGLSGRTVQRRLRMARAAPELLARARAGQLSLGILEAACVEDDHRLQVEAVEACADGWRPAEQVRRRLLRKKPRATGRLAGFVGLDAYRQAGGSVTADLFAERGGGELHLDDPELLERLAGERLAAAAAAERENGWAVTADIGAPEDWRDKYDQERAESPEDLPEAVRGAAEVHLSVGFEGDVDRLVLVRKGAAQAARTSPNGESEGSGRARGTSPNGEKDAPGGGGMAAAPASPNGQARALKLSHALRDDLIHMRAALARRALAEAPADLARDLLAYTLAVKIYEDRWHTSGVSIDHVRAKTGIDDTFDTAVPDCVTAAEEALDARERELLEWLREDGQDARFAALRAMGNADRVRLLACCVARMLTPCPEGHSLADRFLADLVDWPAAFAPGAAVLSRLTRGQLQAIAASHLLPEDADLAELETLKKDEMVTAVAGAFARHRKRSGRSPWIPSAVFG